MTRLNIQRTTWNNCQANPKTKQHFNMPAVACPIEGCAYVTPDMDAIIAAALITAHATTHNTTSNQMAAVKVEKVKRPTISSAGTSEEWTYFIFRWTDYVEATKLSSKDQTVQLLECCDEQLSKDLAIQVAHLPARLNKRYSRPSELSQSGRKTQW